MRLEAGKAAGGAPDMTQRSSFRYFRTSFVIKRLAVMMMGWTPLDGIDVPSVVRKN